MENRVERAVTNHNRGYNCAQSVVCAYCELFGMDESTAFRLAEGFGGGMGGMQDGTCGAVTAMYMLAGLKGSSGGIQNGISKLETYEQVSQLCAAFKEQNGRHSLSGMQRHRPKNDPDYELQALSARLRG